MLKLTGKNDFPIYIDESIKPTRIEKIGELTQIWFRVPEGLFSSMDYFGRTIAVKENSDEVYKAFFGEENAITIRKLEESNQ